MMVTHDLACLSCKTDKTQLGNNKSSTSCVDTIADVFIASFACSGVERNSALVCIGKLRESIFIFIS